MTDTVFNINTKIDIDGCYLWQYEVGSQLKKIIQDKQSFLKKNAEDFWNNWIKDVFNIDTANTFGLSVWGAFLGVGRPSYEDGGVIIDFNDEQYRRVLKGRVMLMMSNGSVSSINKYLNYLFPNKPVFCIDYYDMSMNIVFYYTPTAEEMAVIQMDGFLPRPAGVKVNYVIVPPDEVFGFDGQELANFDNGTFLA